jgi:hypothetical protein
MPPLPLTHHEINNCRDAVSFLLAHRLTQLAVLKSWDRELESEGESVVENDEISRLERLDKRLTEILTYCERCGTRDGTVAPVYPDLIWLCDVCDERV